MTSVYCFVLISQTSIAGTLVGGTHTINNGDNVEQWSLSQNAVLNVESAETLNINASSSTLNANNASTRAVSVSSGSSVNLINTTVSGGNARAGLELVNSTASISGSTINANRFGLQLVREIRSSTGSQATVLNSTITGVTGGARVTAFSSLNLDNSTIQSTGTSSTGLTLLSGTASAKNHTNIIGGQNGAVLNLEGAGLDSSQLELDRSSVEGRNGSAIVVDNAGVTATATRIDVLNGSTLQGSNGIILEVRGAGDALFNVGLSDLNGNITVAEGSHAALNFTQASLVGDVTADATSTAAVVLQQGSQLTGMMNNVASVVVDAQSKWNLTGNSSVGDLALNGGTVKLGAGEAFYHLDVNDLSGSGLFEMKSNFATNQSDFLNVTGTATGNHQVLIASTGSDPASGQPVQVIHIAEGDATFTLANTGGQVDLGTFSYGLKQDQTGHGWFLDPETRTVSPSTRAVTALFNVAPTVWYGELTSLRSRMGELRFNPDKSGWWGLVNHNRYNVNDAFGDGYRQSQQGFTLGADAPLQLGDGQWLVGIMGGHSSSDLDLHRGTSGTIKSYYVGTYLTWMDDVSGYYVDSVLKFNRFQNDAKVGMTDGTRSKGDYDNNGMGGSVEAGRYFDLGEGYFVQPNTQWSAVVIQSKDYDLDNGLHAASDRTRSLLGKIGATIGRNMHLRNGATLQPYMRGAYSHEFSSNNEVAVNNNVFNNDLSGSRVEIGAGVAINLSERWQAHAEFEYMRGKNIEMPMGGTFGVQFKW